MVAKCLIRGNEIYYDEKTQKWICDDELVCPRCHQLHSDDDCDYCLRDLLDCEFIVSACCGHGVEKGYIKLKDGRTFREEYNRLN